MKIRPKILYLLFCLFFPCFGSMSEVWFSPDDHPKQRLLQFINASKIKIYAAIYMFTEKDIAEALALAKQRGVDVRIVLDPVSVEQKYGKIGILQENNIPISVFDTKQHHSADARVRAFAPLMHDKFAVIDDVVWTGSFNWTQSANSRNQENVIVTDDKSVCQKFEKQFSILVERCIPLPNYSLCRSFCKNIKSEKRHKLYCRCDMKDRFERTGRGCVRAKKR